MNSRHVNNSQAIDAATYPEHLAEWLNLEGFQRAWTEIRTWPDYTPTPLVDLPALAQHLGVAAISYKDESKRFSLKSFKALGGAYAVLRLLQSQLKHHVKSKVTSAALRAGDFKSINLGITVCCATDGNHGRAVAWAASMFGCRAVIYVHERVTSARIEEIERLGATVVVSPGTYDDAVERLARDATQRGWHVVSDTSYEGYVDVPCDVMQGYTVMVEEALQALPTEHLPTHVFIQAGAGALAAAVCAHLWLRLGQRRPRFVVIQSDQAAGIFESIARRKLQAFPGELDTIMAGLSVGLPSLIAWNILRDGANDVITISDEDAVDAMRVLARPHSGDSTLTAGESGAAGLAGVLASSRSPQLAGALGLTPASRILVFGTEGDTDPESYRKLVNV